MITQKSKLYEYAISKMSGAPLKLWFTVLLEMELVLYP